MVGITLRVKLPLVLDVGHLPRAAVQTASFPPRPASCLGSRRAGTDRIAALEVGRGWPTGLPPALAGGDRSQTTLVAAGFSRACNRALAAARLQASRSPAEAGSNCCTWVPTPPAKAGGKQTAFVSRACPSPPAHDRVRVNRAQGQMVAAPQRATRHAAGLPGGSRRWPSTQSRGGRRRKEKWR